MSGQSEDFGSRSEARREPLRPVEAHREREKAEIVRLWEEGRKNYGLELQVSEELDRAYQRPGQYVTLRLPGMKARFFVIATRPGERRWEFLIDREGGFGQALADLRVGDRVEVSQPEGRGFEVQEAVGRVALLFCTGSGVATIRGLVEAWLERGEEGRPKEMVLYYGEEEAGVGTYEELFEQWKRRGVRIHRAVERGGEEPSVTIGHVQNAFEAHRAPLEDAVIYLSGALVMIEAVSALMERAGVEPGRVKTNI